MTKAYKVDRETDREPTREGLAAAVRNAIDAAVKGGLKYAVIDVKTAGHVLAKLETRK